MLVPIFVLVMVVNTLATVFPHEPTLESNLASLGLFCSVQNLFLTRTLLSLPLDFVFSTFFFLLLFLPV